MKSKNYDVFVSHASEDKEEIARPLASLLIAKGYIVWFDEFTLSLGDSLRQSIDKGLGASRYGVVILSPSFLDKNWPEYELNSLVQLELDRGKKCILPIWHKLNKSMVLEYSPSLADKVADVSTIGLEKLCERISEVVGEPSNNPMNVSTISDGVIDGNTCPQCGQEGQYYGYEGSDGDEAHWFECNHCGHFDGL